ncbi:hypothetical protein DNI29_04360 [Hymenobacter sediminis]|uniref:hypothetical protein n=1 Tax=Hymenobacter sediminis TaxID=2218621 RepID=UPI000F504A04|nr:hypothetical protein [Hymenobacter sediminis]RPD50036.1 hypothetical protein DNI29_04360 [Hymenobacter sediminis]
MPLSPEHRAIMDEVNAAYEQAMNAPLRRDKCFSWQQLTVGQALSRMYVAGLRAAQAGVSGNIHEWHIENAKETHD